MWLHAWRTTLWDKKISCMLCHIICVKVVFDYYKQRKSFREWRDLFTLSYSFLKNVFFPVGPSFVKGMACLSIRMSQLSCWFCSALTLIIHSYEWMLLSIVLCYKDLDCGWYLFFCISTFTILVKIDFVIFHVSF